MQIILGCQVLDMLCPLSSTDDVVASSTDDVVTSLNACVIV